MEDHLAGAERTVPLSVGQLLDEVPVSRFHRRALLVAGVGFFTDAYDLFVISTVALLVKTQWHLSTSATSWVTGAAILGAFAGALLFGRVADLLGRRRVFVLVAALMIAGALLSALAQNVVWLVLARVLLGLGIGGDYPVSAVLMSEYSNRKDRGRLVGMVFSMQAVGLVVGPLVAITLLGSGLGHDATWRVLLALGAVPAAAVIYLRTKMPESPRYQAQVKGSDHEALSELTQYSDGAVAGSRPLQERCSSMTLRSFFANRRMLGLVVGTAGAWFLFDYAYYGNTLSLPAILKGVDPHATVIQSLALSLALFVAFAVPGYLFAILWMDRIGHRRLQLLGFAVMALSFLALGAIGPLTEVMGLFITVFGLSYFFVQFGPNTTTFVLPSEVFPTSVRTTGHGLAAGVGKLGAFIGVFLVPQLQSGIGLRGMLAVAATASLGGWLLTRLLPEPSGRSLEELGGVETVSPRLDVVPGEELPELLAPRSA